MSRPKKQQSQASGGSISAEVSIPSISSVLIEKRMSIRLHKTKKFSVFGLGNEVTTPTKGGSSNLVGSRSLTYSLTHSLTHSLTNSLTHVFTHSLTHSLTHFFKLTHSLAY